MIIGVGIDVCQVARFEVMLSRRPRIVEHLFTEAESRLPDGRMRSAHSLAARFAAKEAFAKALGAPGGLAWHDAQLLSDANSRPRFEVCGTVAQALAERGITSVHVSLSHDGGLAMAFVICEG